LSFVKATLHQGDAMGDRACPIQFFVDCLPVLVFEASNANRNPGFLLLEYRFPDTSLKSLWGFLLFVMLRNNDAIENFPHLSGGSRFVLSVTSDLLFRFLESRRISLNAQK